MVPPRLTPTSLVVLLEQESELVHGTPLKILRHVDIDGLRRVGVLVPKDVLDLLQRNPLAPQQRGAGVPEIVEADTPDPAQGTEFVEVPVYVPGSNGVPRLVVNT